MHTAKELLDRYIANELVVAYRAAHPKEGT